MDELIVEIDAKNKAQVTSYCPMAVGLVNALSMGEKRLNY